MYLHTDTMFVLQKILKHESSVIRVDGFVALCDLSLSLFAISRSCVTRVGESRSIGDSSDFQSRVCCRHKSRASIHPFRTESFHAQRSRQHNANKTLHPTATRIQFDFQASIPLRMS